MSNNSKSSAIRELQEALDNTEDLIENLMASLDWLTRATDPEEIAAAQAAGRVTLAEARGKDA